MVETERQKRIILIVTLVASVVVVGFMVLMVKLTPNSCVNTSPENKLLSYIISCNQTGNTPLWFLNAQKNASVIGQDGGNSIPLGNNTSWLVFGDTIPNNGAWRSNSGLLLKTDGQGDVKEASFVVDEDGVVAQLIPFQGNETISTTAIWGGAGIYAFNRTWMFYSISDRTGKSPDRAGLAVAEGMSSEFVRFDFPSLMGGLAPMQVLVENGADVNNPDTFLYMYVLRKGFFDFDVHIARIPLGALLNLETLGENIQWFNQGNSWSSLDPNVTTAISQSQVIAGGVGAQITVFWNDYLKSYAMLIAPEFSSSIEMVVSDNIWGPWSCPTLLFNAPVKKNEFLYCPYLHPELQSKDSPFVSLSYSIGGSNEKMFPLFAELLFTPKK
eukprot:TRINITY_DN2652_c0_g1_i1.p1 TRINITY_DN2652_c0_g1~~TRINITY_DN2652_c0_g1_i1.p1  ORF type:complete len:385 (-),score=72.64 TRINITY_DN2652_c0_g1_i1:87-1241(-)